jgi:hypothetical protein
LTAMMPALVCERCSRRTVNFQEGGEPVPAPGATVRARLDAGAVAVLVMRCACGCQRIYRPPHFEIKTPTQTRGDALPGWE